MSPLRHSPKSAEADRRQLVRPTSILPWSVDVVSAVPRRLSQKMKAVASAQCPGWACLTQGDGFVHVWRPTVHALTEHLQPSTAYTSPFFPDLIASDRSKIWLAMTPDRSGDAVHLYALHQDWLLVSKLTARELLQERSFARSHSNKLRLVLEDEGDSIVSLTANERVILLTSRLGYVYWVTHTAVPVGLQVSKLLPPQGFLGRWLGLGTSSNQQEQQVLIVPLATQEYVSFSTRGSQITMMHWKKSLYQSNMEAILQTTLKYSWSQPKLVSAVFSKSASELHLLVVEGAPPEEDGNKLHWLQIDALDGTLTETRWLTRFAEPPPILGMSVADNGLVYAVANLSPIVVMVLTPQGVLHDVDLPPNTTLVAGMVQADTVTHGCSLWSTDGLGLRVRYIPSDDGPSAKRARKTSTTTTTSSGSSSLTLTTLVSHLRSTFWQAYQDPKHHPTTIAPSLLQADEEDLEQAVLLLAQELQHKGDSTNAQNPMEWHQALLKVLQQGGLYKRLSQSSRWQLLSIGQELAAFSHLCREGYLVAADGIKSYHVAEWLLQQQQQHQSDSWNDMLATTLQVAQSYRDDMAGSMYDIRLEDSTVMPKPLWTSHAPLQTVLREQLVAWKRQGRREHVAAVHVRAVVEAALVSFSEHFDTKESYAAMRELAIGLLRAQGDDVLAFDLSTQYEYMEGLCQISVDHEHEQDAIHFRIDPLLDTMQESRELLTGYTFCQFVLQWHTDHGLYGHAINYGRHSPTDLTLIMKNDPRLRKFQWIPSIRHGYMDQATEACISLGKESARESMHTSQWAWSMAKLANKLVISPQSGRQQTIERQLELVAAQRALQEANPSLLSASLRTPDELLQLTLQELTKDTNRLDDQVRYATIALAVCSVLPESEMTTQTAKVWSTVWRLNADDFARWIQTSTDLSEDRLKQVILEQTAFGSLFVECQVNPTMGAVTYGRHLESAVLAEGIGENHEMEVVRLLRNITSGVGTETMQAESLVVASY